jgi:hypothetical protein
LRHHRLELTHAHTQARQFVLFVAERLPVPRFLFGEFLFPPGDDFPQPRDLVVLSLDLRLVERVALGDLAVAIGNLNGSGSSSATRPRSLLSSESRSLSRTSEFLSSMSRVAKLFSANVIR